jgi:alkylhydroperoxidase/carboxymuconolactone decarboxylase family protein YurZ
MEPIKYPLSKQETILSNSDRLREISPDVADAFKGLRSAADGHSTVTAREHELILLAGFAAGRNEGGFRVHCLRAAAEGVSLAELEQVVLLMLGTSLGLAPVVETLSWLHDELK